MIPNMIVNNIDRVYFTKYHYCTKDGKIFRDTFYINVYKRGKIVKIIQPKKQLIGKKTSKKGYLRIRINNKTYFAHRIIAMCFLYVENYNNLQVNHKNGNKLDNKIENLEFCTNQQNRDHAVKMNLIAKRDKLSKKIKQENIKEIIKMYKYGMLQKNIAKKYNVCQQTISNILKISRQRGKF